jgi:hypothetical protein
VNTEEDRREGFAQDRAGLALHLANGRADVKSSRTVFGVDATAAVNLSTELSHFRERALHPSIGVLVEQRAHEHARFARIADGQRVVDADE